MRPGSSDRLTCQGWAASRGIKGGSAPLARSYRGPDNVAGPILGQLNPATPWFQGGVHLPHLNRPVHLWNEMHRFRFIAIHGIELDCNFAAIGGNHLQSPVFLQIYCTHR